MVGDHAAGTVGKQARGMGQQAVDIDFAEWLYVKGLQNRPDRNVQADESVLHKLSNGY